MEKENVFDQIPPKVWLAAIGGVTIIIVLLLWILFSSSKKQEALKESEINALSEAEVANQSPDIPSPETLLVGEGSVEDVDSMEDVDEKAALEVLEALGTESEYDFVEPSEDLAEAIGEEVAGEEAAGEEAAELLEMEEDAVVSEEVVSEAVEPANDAVKAAPVGTRETTLTLADSDSAVRRNFAYLNDEPFYKALWRPSNLLQRWVTFTFGLSKGQVMHPVVSLQTPKSSFPVRRIGARYFLDESGFDRFTPYINHLVAISPKTWADNFHYFRPLLEKTFGQMGYKESDFDNTVTKALHEIISAEIPSGALELKAPSAMYVFVDDAIEKMSPLQKQMIRMGPDNAKMLQDYAKKVRSELLRGAK